MITIIQIIGLFGGGTVLATGIATFVANLFQKKTAIAWQEKANHKLTELKQQIEKDKLRLESVLSHYSGVYSVAQEERIKAANAVWAATFKVREIGSSAVFFYSILTENEYDESIKKPSFHAAAYKTGINELTNVLYNTLQDIEKLRPLIGERLWNLFSVYGSFSGRLAYKLRDQADKGHILPWHEDKGIQQFISVLFSSEEQKRIDYKTPLGLQSVVWQIESKIVFECSRIISGKIAISESIEQTGKIRTMLETYGINKKI